MSWVVLTLDITQIYRGSLEIMLESPSGTKTVLVVPHNDSNDDYPSWPFPSRTMWKEDPNGKWKVHVRNILAGVQGVVNLLELNIYN